MPYVEETEEMKMGGLLDSSDSESESESPMKPPSSTDVKLKVNKRFATSYESKKRRQELSRAREMGMDGDDGDDGYSSSSSSESDSDAEQLTEDVDLKVLKTIKMIREKNPKIYDSSTEFFEHPAEGGVVGGGKGKGEKRMSYKDVVREQTLEDMEGGPQADERKRFAYDDEQEEIRKAFLTGVGGSDDEDEEGDGDGMLKVKVKSNTDEEREKRMEEEFNKMESVLSPSRSPIQDPKGEIADPDAFLREFAVKRKWKDNDEWGGIGEEEEKELEEEDREDEEVDRFESKYNFRFEEEGSGEIKGYSRNQEGLRKEDSKRKDKRKERKERKRIEREKKVEELRRLKNVKRKELERQVEMVKEIGGLSGTGLDEEGIMKMLEGDYDPEAFEKALGGAFGEDYYGMGGEDEWEGVKKAMEGEVEYDDNVIGDEGGKEEEKEEEEEEEEEDGVMDNGNEYDEEEEDSDEERGGEKVKELTSNIKKTAEDLYNLDYEDIIAGDLKTRFKYRMVPKNDYGLTAKDILRAEDNELNRYVSLKKLATYREDEWRVGMNAKKKFKENLRRKEKEKEREKLAKEAEEEEERKRAELEVVEGENGGEGKKKKRRRKKGKKVKKGDTGVGEEEKEEEEEEDMVVEKEEEGKGGGDTDKKEKKQKKKRRRTKDKIEGLSDDRLAAYGL